MDEHAQHKHGKAKTTSSDQKQTLDALLSITSAAVQALDKPRTPRRSDSVGPPSSLSMQPGPVSDIQALSADVLTGVYAGLTPTNEVIKSTGQPNSPNGPENVSVGSRSSTASEILVRTTTTDPGVYYPSESLDLSTASKISQNSRTSAASSTFLTGEAKRVRVSSKKLKEIKSPFEEGGGERTSVSSGKLGFFQMLDNSSLLKSPGRQTDKSVCSDTKTDVETSDRKGKSQSTVCDCSDIRNADISHSQELTTNLCDSQCGRKITDISVNVVKHHAVRRHTTEPNHSIVVERHNTDSNVSQLSEPIPGSNRSGIIKMGSQELRSGLDSGYQTKQLPTKVLYGTETLNDMKSASANTSADIEGMFTSSCSHKRSYLVRCFIYTCVHSVNY